MIILQYIRSFLSARGAGHLNASGNLPWTRPKKLVLACAVLVGASALSPWLTPTEAATTDSTIGVTSAVQATCLNTATPLAFGTYTGLIATGTAIVTITCTNTTPYTVGLDAGLATGATVTTRQMTGPAGALLAYTLSSDASHAVNWGLTVGTDTVAGVATGAAQPITVYGQEAAGQFVAPGAYTDTITATVTY
jgi:spore coat protein U-like protein